MASCHCRLMSVSTARQAVRSLSEDAIKTLVQSFFSCHLGYCNSVLQHLGRTDEPVAVDANARERRLGLPSTTCRTCVVTVVMCTFGHGGFADAGPVL